MTGDLNADAATMQSQKMMHSQAAKSHHWSFLKKKETKKQQQMEAVTRVNKQQPVGSPTNKIVPMLLTNPDVAR